MTDFTAKTESPLSEWMGFETVEATPERTLVRLALRPEHLNPHRRDPCGHHALAGRQYRH